MKYYNLYCDWTKQGSPFLCHYFERPVAEEDDEIFQLVKPQTEEEVRGIPGGLTDEEVDRYGKDSAWGMDPTFIHSNKWGTREDFTPIRQNIVLLMACLNNEDF